MTITKKRSWILAVLVVVLVACLATAGIITAFAVTTADTVEYPFQKGANAFKNAPIWTGTTESKDEWQFFRVNFPTTDLTQATYFAIETKVTKGSPRFTFGAQNYTSGDSRYSTMVAGKSFFYVRENGTVETLAATANGDTPIGDSTGGMLLIPVSDLTWQFGDDQTLAKIGGYFFTANALYVRDFEVVIGEVGYYTGDPANGGTFTKLLDLTGGEKQDKYLYSSLGNGKITFPSELAVVDPVPETTIEYPFVKGELAFKGAMKWTGPVDQYVPATDATPAEPADNWQTFKVKFDNGAVNLSDATYIAVQYFAKSGAPGLTYGLTNKDARYSINGHDSEKVYVFGENGTCSTEIKILYGSANVSGTGMLLIPMSSMGWQFGSAANKNLNAITELLFTTNSKYNYNYEVVIGEVGYYTGDLADNNFTKLVDLSNGTNVENYVVTSDVARQCGTMSVNKIDRMVYGDVVLSWTATGKTANQFGIWDGGSMGKVEMVTDSYGDEAAKLTCTGANPNGDKYTATTIADGIKWQWAGKKGVTLWARNDSDIEVSFNLEMDVTNPQHVKPGSNSHNARHNIVQGGSFYLYDVNTGKQTIYMTRPCLTLPKGFEGWVYVPFADFNQAEWSQNEGVMPRSMFLNENGTMANGSYVSYMAITVFSGDYINKPFSINKIGAYETTPLFSSALVDNRDKTIPVLMDLPALPQAAEEVK